MKTLLWNSEVGGRWLQCDNSTVIQGWTEMVKIRKRGVERLLLLWMMGELWRTDVEYRLLDEIYCYIIISLDGNVDQSLYCLVRKRKMPQMNVKYTQYTYCLTEKKGGFHCIQSANISVWGVQCKAWSTLYFGIVHSQLFTLLSTPSQTFKNHWWGHLVIQVVKHSMLLSFPTVDRYQYIGRNYSGKQCGLKQQASQDTVGHVDLTELH